MGRQCDNATIPLFSIERVLNKDTRSVSGALRAAVHDHGRAEEAPRPPAGKLLLAARSTDGGPPSAATHPLATPTSVHTETQVKWAAWWGREGRTLSRGEPAAEGGGELPPTKCSRCEGRWFLTALLEGEGVGGLPHSCAWDMGPCFTMPGPPVKISPHSPRQSRILSMDNSNFDFRIEMAQIRRLSWVVRWRSRQIPNA